MGESFDVCMHRIVWKFWKEMYKEETMMTSLQIALLASSLALLLTVIVGFYFGTFASGSPRYFFVWFIALNLTFAGLCVARFLTMRKKSL